MTIATCPCRNSSADDERTDLKIAKCGATVRLTAWPCHQRPIRQVDDLPKTAYRLADGGLELRCRRDALIEELGHASAKRRLFGELLGSLQLSSLSLYAGEGEFQAFNLAAGRNHVRHDLIVLLLDLR